MGEKTFITNGRLLRTVRLRDEGYEFIDRPEEVIDQLRLRPNKADIFTFTQRLSETSPTFPYDFEFDGVAVLPITTYSNWWTKQINDKTRNMVRKAGKKGVEIRVVDFNDELIAGIKSIHDEHPLRQGKPFKHYGKPFDTVKRDHSSYLDKSDFIAAYSGTELIGIVKLVHQGSWSCLMQIISKISHREKSPTNALLAKAVEICSERGVPLLQYGQWSSRGIGAFKLNHGFERREVPRYFVPLTPVGKLGLKCGLHRNPANLLPPAVLNFLMDTRSRWYNFRFRRYQLTGQ